MCVIFSQLNFKCLIAVESWELPYWTDPRKRARADSVPWWDKEQGREGGLTIRR